MTVQVRWFDSAGRPVDPADPKVRAFIRRTVEETLRTLRRTA